MKTAFYLDASLYRDSLTESLRPLTPDGRHAVDEVRRRCVGLRDRFDLLILSCGPDFPGDEAGKFRSDGFMLRSVEPPQDLQGLLRQCREAAQELGLDALALFYSDAPLLDSVLTIGLLDISTATGAEYVFADNLPEGLVPEILTRDFLEEIVAARPKRRETVSRRLFDNLDADINRVFAEVWLPEEDLSPDRLDLHADTPRNSALLRNIFSRLAEPDFAALCGLRKSDPGVFRIAPRYVELEAVNRGPECVYLPRMNRPEVRLDPELFRRICSGLAAEMPDVIAAFAGPNEPLLHPQALDMVEYAANESGLFSFILETDGLLFGPEVAERISRLDPARCQVIFRLDAVRSATYSLLRPGADLDSTVRNIDAFLSLREENRSRTFVQFVKLKENLAEMEEFWKFWEARKVPVIIQKFNGYCGRVDRERVSDLTPLDRTVCWRLQREMTVMADGRVPVCKQAACAETPVAVADLNRDSVREAWMKLEPYFLENALAGWDRPGAKHPLCASCDEWYPFNF